MRGVSVIGIGSTNFGLLGEMTLEEMTEGLNRGWGERDSRVTMLLQEERAGVEIRVPEAELRQVLDLEKDPASKL